MAGMTPDGTGGRQNDPGGNGSRILSPMTCLVSLAIAFQLLFFALPASSGIYQWRDADGNVIYSDSPPSGVDAREKKYRNDRIERRQTKDDDRRVTRTSESQPRLRDAGDISVILYMTDWCPYCRKAREYLGSTGVRVTEYNIDKDRKRNEEMRRKSGSGAIPVIDVEGIIIRGYSPDAIQSAIDRKRKEGG